MVDPMAVVALVVGFGLLARWMLGLHRENVSLRKARSRTAAILRNLKRGRDALADCLRLAGDEYQELHERCVELESELSEYRKEDARIQVRRAEIGRLN